MGANATEIVTAWVLEGDLTPGSFPGVHLWKKQGVVGLLNDTTRRDNGSANASEKQTTWVPEGERGETLLFAHYRSHPELLALRPREVISELSAALFQLRARFAQGFSFVLMVASLMGALILALSWSARRSERALLLLLGASDGQRRLSTLGELMLLGLIAGLIAAVGSALFQEAALAFLSLS